MHLDNKNANLYMEQFLYEESEKNLQYTYFK